ncbi:MAG: hypothetical protein HN348_30980, partial [Proteobacteria bacterium]|nr:hypothetical protein [Pseudomonadota bacterium]
MDSSPTIVATLGPASSSPRTIEQLRFAGADLARLNASHLDVESLKVLSHAAVDGGFGPEQLILDIQGGKTRLGCLDEPLAVETGSELHLYYGETPDLPLPLPVDRPGFVNALKVNDLLRVDDGRLAFRVTEKRGSVAKVQVECGGIVRSRKGLAQVGKVFVANELLPRDLQLMKAALADGISRFAVSYAVHSEQLKIVRCQVGSEAQIIAKIEHPDAIQNWRALANESDAFWLCRGDLGAEVGLENLPGLQRIMLNEAAKHLPLFVAGQVLHHTTVSSRPTRSEVCHLADLVCQGAAGF